MYSQMKRGFLKEGLASERKTPAPPKPVAKPVAQGRPAEIGDKASSASTTGLDDGVYGEMKRVFLKQGLDKRPIPNIDTLGATHTRTANSATRGRFRLVCPEDKSKVGQPNYVFRMPSPCYCTYSVDGGETEMIMIGSRPELEQIIPFGEVALQKPLPHFEEGLFRVAETEQKGLGMFATRLIKAGELIVAERPTVISSKTSHGTKYRVPYELSFYDAALAALSERARASFMALGDCCSLGERAHPLPGRIMTNGYTCGPMTDSDADGSRIAFSSTYPTLPRANHDCAANAQYSWNKVRWCGQFYAARDIPAGDEITTKYVTDTTQAERHASLERRYSYRCLCKTCLGALPEDVERSDERRTAVAQLLHTLETALDPDEYPMLWERSVRRTLGYAREEGMMFQYARILWEVGRIMQVQENALVGFEWLKEARKAHVLVLGEENWLVAQVDDTGEFLAARLRECGFPCTWP